VRGDEEGLAKRQQLIEREGYRAMRLANADIVARIDDVIRSIADHMFMQMQRDRP